MLTYEWVATRGNPSIGSVAHFWAPGFDAGHRLDILIGIAQKTLSNYTNPIAGTPPDARLKAYV
ncbi:MAG: hypothetical protein ACYC3N_03255 [Halothiobacillus sp.]